MRAVGFLLVLIAGLSAYGLVLTNDEASVVAVVEAEPVAAVIEPGPKPAEPVVAARSPPAPSDEEEAGLPRTHAPPPRPEPTPQGATPQGASGRNIAEPAREPRGPIVTGTATEPAAPPSRPVAEPPPAPITPRAAPPPTERPEATALPAAAPTAPAAGANALPAKVATAPVVSDPVAVPAAGAPPLPPASTPPTSTPPAAAEKTPWKGPPDARIAKVAFGLATTAAPLAARAIGFYSRGCLAGAKMLPADGPAWQAMRLSRNRNWGHPDLVRLVERLAADARVHEGWPGLLIGDMAQPRGGPMRTGHASHQVGLDADIWLTPMPDRRLTSKEREDLAATDMLGPYKLTVDPAVWTPKQGALIKRAASYHDVERIFVHPAIKKALCETAGFDRQWLSKVRPMWGHNYHFHVRISCPTGSPACRSQALPSTTDDGCGKELDDWFQLLSKPEPPPPPAPPPDTAPPAPRGLRVDQLPPECKQVLEGSESLVRRFFRWPAKSPAAHKAAEKAQRAAVGK